MALSRPKVISARDTFPAKFFISTAFLAAAVSLAWLIALGWARADKHGVWFLRIVTQLACIGASLAVVWFCGSLKRVALSGTSLHVSNFLREIVVPLADVRSVEQIDGIFYRIVVAFESETAFGRRIGFSPMGLSPPKPHPIVAELRAAVAAAKGQ